MPEELPVPQAANAQPAGMSQMQRVVDTFLAPVNTFTNILHNTSWWLPYLIAAVLGIAFGFTATQKIGYERLTDAVIHQRPSLEETISNSTPAEAAQMRARIEGQFKYAIYLTPVIIVLVGLLCAAVLLATVNFGLGGTATFGQMAAVWFYSGLPLAFISLLAIIAIYAGMGADQFNMQNPVGTNVGYYLPSDTPKWLSGFADSLDIFSIWSACLLTIGMSVVGKVKRSAAAIAVFSWWLLYILIFKIALASMGS